MRTAVTLYLRVAAIAVLGVISTVAACDAQQARWPAATGLPKPAPEPAAPPAYLERAPTVVASKAFEKQCTGSKVCVICVAACDTPAPVVIQSLRPVPTSAIVAASTENDSDGISPNAPRYARQDWAGITCGSVGGCRVSGVTAPSSSSYSVDVRMSIFTSYGSGGASSHYIDR